MAFSGAQFTRLGGWGGPRGLYGSFDSKTAVTVKAGGGSSSAVLFLLIEDKRHGVVAVSTKIR